VVADRVISVLSFALAVAYLLATRQIPALEIGDPLGPRAFPQLLGAGLILAAILLFIETLKKAPRAEGEAAASAGSPWGVVALVAVWTGAYFLLFETLGYVVASAAYLLVLMAVFNRGRWTMNVATAVLFSAVTYWVFTRQLGVTLPAGLLGLAG
jgi:putative tricarboxylic transport membrane protein